MTSKDSENEKKSLYQVGLNQQSESVISAHFMHKINLDLHNNLYSNDEFSKTAIRVDARLLLEKLIPCLLAASNKFIALRAKAVEKRARINYKSFGLATAQEIGLAEIIAEVMFDRQFLKGPRENVSRKTLTKTLKGLIEQKKPIEMVVLALPYKSSSPLKCIGDLPDLAELNFLLSVYEMAKVIDYHYQQHLSVNHVLARFKIISDGSRFNSAMNERDEVVKDYQRNLQWWVQKLALENYVSILDYKHVITNLLATPLQEQKAAIREQVTAEYKHKMMPLLNVYNMAETISKAIEIDPDPELNNPQGRFVPLFNSLIYIVRFKLLTSYAKHHAKNYTILYQALTRHLLEPFCNLSQTDLEHIESFINNHHVTPPEDKKIMEFLRQSMLKEAWEAAIDYIAEIRSDRDLTSEPIGACFKDHLRWTIHPKSGQLALLTTTTKGDPIQAWHGIGLFKESKHQKIKTYVLPRLSLESTKAIPILPENIENEPLSKEQPFFYIDSQIKFSTMEEFFEILQNNLIRSRK